MLITESERLALRTEHPFTIVRETLHEIEPVIVRIEDAEGHVGVGGAGPSRHYGETVRMTRVLADYDVEFVEQPLPAEHHEGLRFVYEHATLPIALDESCVRPADIPRIADRADIINLKLMKCGGLRPVPRMIHTARAHGLEVMLGCMIESNASIAAAAHLAPLLDYADLDGSLLLAEDPYEGVPMPEGRIDLEALDRPGTGAWRDV